MQLLLLLLLMLFYALLRCVELLTFSGYNKNSHRAETILIVSEKFSQALGWQMSAQIVGRKLLGRVKCLETR